MALGDLFAWFFWFYVAVACIALFVTLFIDIFRDETLNGWGKALWVLFLVILPILGSLIYLIARGSSMSARRARDREYVSDADGLIRPV
jgi:ABC-type multidrug transport system fused ATPase/permease subunit